ncbi:unnamed protein product [marine sediment metagenome]|uniref:Uncharacterized protein n=1 Tax=marine sediment metagenome TaxID=412755 RepID=X1EGP3_9ZZZZ
MMIQKMNNIHVVAVKDFPDDIILFLSGEINLDKLDEEVKMKKIIWARIKDE